jgi:hypothetical protein
MSTFGSTQVTISITYTLKLSNHNAIARFSYCTVHDRDTHTRTRARSSIGTVTVIHRTLPRMGKTPDPHLGGLVLKSTQIINMLISFLVFFPDPLCRWWATFPTHGLYHEKQGRQCANKPNTLARSRTHCCRGKAISVTYSEYPILIKTHVPHHIVISGLSGSIFPH